MVKPWNAPVHRRQVYVIDDDPSVRKSLQRLIRSAGFGVRTFGGAQEFLDARIAEPDCLVVDVRMPGMSGLEFQQHLAAQGRRLPMIFISAHVDEDARQTAFRLGASDFIQKPFEAQQLLAALARLAPALGE